MIQFRHWDRFSSCQELSYKFELPVKYFYWAELCFDADKNVAIHCDRAGNFLCEINLSNYLAGLCGPNGDRICDQFYYKKSAYVEKLDVFTGDVGLYQGLALSQWWLFD